MFFVGLIEAYSAYSCWDFGSLFGYLPEFDWSQVGLLRYSYRHISIVLKGNMAYILERHIGIKPSIIFKYSSEVSHDLAYLSYR